MKSKEELTTGFDSLVVFRNLLKNKTVADLRKLCETGDMHEYSEFVAGLYAKSDNLSEFLLNRVFEDENIYVTLNAQNKPVSKHIQECVNNELAFLEKVSRLTPEDFRGDYKGFLPAWSTSEIDFNAEYKKRVEHIGDFGYGIFAKYYMFMVQDSVITPVKTPDDTTLSRLIGYKLERKSVIDNTLALINGKPALNTLLYGDAGTGKSSTVKAIVNEYKDHGLRLIEVAKSQLRDIPAIIDSLSRNPLKFIIFIDDLSFNQDDDDFGALKAILEGSVSARTSNIVIYATSNRRHLVKETFSGREGDEVHRNDTIQELISLSERFGLTVNFSKPDKNQYIDIIHGLAEQNNLDIPLQQLDLQAEAFALRRGGRSPRLAKQFIDYLLSSNPESDK